jgi:Domain of unknown function (DUF1772)
MAGMARFGHGRGMPSLLATLATALFAGAAVYINLVEHPARLSCGTAAALQEWRPSYKRATMMQASLAVAGTLLAVAAWWSGAGAIWILGAIALGAVVPYTLIVMFPVNKRLERADLDPASPEALALLQKWGWLHAIRSVLSLLALVVFLTARR